MRSDTYHYHADLDDHLDYDDFDDFDALEYSEQDANEFDAGTVNPVEILHGFRKLLRQQFRNVSLEELDDCLCDVFDTMTPIEEFNFGNMLKSVGKGAKGLPWGQIAQTALPIAGTVVGGPIGGQVAQTAGQMLFKGKQQGKGSQAAAQLMQMASNPTVLNALGSLAMGNMGAQTVPIGASGQSAPVASIISMLGELTKQASADAEEFSNYRGSAYSHLQDADGDFLIDPTIPAERARMLYITLIDAENQSLDF